MAVLDDGNVCNALKIGVRCRATTLIPPNTPRELRGLCVDPVIIYVSPRGVPQLELISEAMVTAPQAKIIATTAYPTFRLAIDVIKAGAVDCLTKPLRASEVERVLGLAPSAGDPAPSPRMPSLARVEWEYLSHVLALVDGNLSAAARILGIERSTLQRKLKKHPPNW